MGERIGAYRRRRGLSQATLAGLVGRSESWLSQVERGIRSVDRLSVLLDMARILHVEVEALIGRPWDLAPNGAPTADELAGVRSFFGRYDQLTQSDSREVDPDPLRARVAQANRDYQAARYDKVIAELPSLLTDADAAHRGQSSAGRRELLLLYVSAYAVAAKLLTKLGASDLALVAADRSALAALDAESLAARGVAAYQVVCAMLRAGRTDDAEHLAVAMAEQVQASATSDAPSLVSVAGALWLIAAVIAARRTERFEALDRLQAAERLAGLLGHDANHMWTAFGPTNVAIHRVSVAAELGDAAEALRSAMTINPESLPQGLQSRRAQMYLDLAWAQGQRKRDAEATLSLLEAERIAPQAVHYNVVVRELMREMLARSGRTRTTSLEELARRAGVLL
jgi:transcriptional regulator with XRE-family HTH domain